MAVFLEEGLHGARMERIAETASVSKRTLYKHFESKEVLFDEITKSVLETLSSMHIPEFDPNASLEDQVLEALRIYYSHVTAEPFMIGARVLIGELMRSPDFAHRFNKEFALIDAPLAEFLAGGIACGELKANAPNVASDRLLALFKATIFIPLLTHESSVTSSENMQRVARESTDIFLRQFAAG